MGVTLFFLEKISRPLLAIASESDDFFSFYTTPIFPRRLSSFLSKFSHKKLILRRVLPPSDATA